jgi:hypothetical protein
MEVHPASVAIAVDQEDDEEIISALTPEYVHELLELWFGDLHSLDDIPEEKYAL